MIKLNDALLAEFGMGDLPPSHQNAILTAVYQELEFRVGARLVQSMTDQQLTEFESLIDRGDQPRALAWLETNLPNYRLVVHEELATIRGELAVCRAEIFALSKLYDGVEFVIAPRVSQWRTPV